MTTQFTQALAEQHIAQLHADAAVARLARVGRGVRQDAAAPAPAPRTALRQVPRWWPRIRQALL